ncbi:MAG: GGDEF domain-containing protein [Burkholderiales bacterium]|nr:GGDEF domain-containing protein [Burkholderiales bacterium]
MVLVGCAWRAVCVSLVLACTAPIEASAAQSAVDPTARILELEDLGRGRPTEAARQLDHLRGATAEFSPQRLELLTVQGVTLAVASQADAAERSAAQLDAWGRTPGAAMARNATAAALLIRARSLARGGDLPGAEALMREAMAQLPGTLPARDRFRFVFAQGYIADQSGKLEQAVRLNYEAMALADRQDELWRKSEARTALAYSYYNAKQYERARALSLAAIALAEQGHDWVSLARANNTSGMVLNALGDLQGERRSFELALALARRAGSKVDEVRYLANLADYYLRNADYNTALDQARRALPLARELKDRSSEMVALANIGLAYISLQHIQLGKRYVYDAIAIDEQRGAINSMSDSWDELGSYLEKAGDLPGAVAAYHEHRRLLNGILQDSRQKAILAMQEQYDADQRSRALVLLNRENALKVEQLRRQDLQRRMGWLLAAALVLSLAVLALLYRRVRQSNRLLAHRNEQLKAQGECDPLTGLANRRQFQAVMRRRAVDGTLSGTVYLIDIDHFKTINDRHGHAAGDAVLVEVARRLRETLREPDLIVRWGGEEFLVVVQALAPEQVDGLAQRMLGVLDQAPVAVESQRIDVTGSIGYATFPIGPASLRVSWERAIELVDTAMYLAKAHGRNRAYGVRLMQACDEAALDAITRALESAWRDGRVTLTQLPGRTPRAAA